MISAVAFALYWGAAILCGIELFRLLGFYRRGEIFTTRSARQIRRWGLACVGMGIVKFAYAFLPLVVHNSRLRATDISTLLSTALIGLMIVAISWFMEMAAQIREENELTV